MKQDVLDTHQKALQLNLDGGFHGALAEMGTGPEVAHWFFRVGGASGTIARTLSAYDTTFGDAIYGPCECYVSRARLETMLEHDYRLVGARPSAWRGNERSLFAFASTVATPNPARRDEAHGWLGIRFQSRPQAAPSQIAVHVRLLDPESVPAQEILGVLGVNLVFGARRLHRDPDALVRSLLDDVPAERIEVVALEFSGTDFAGVDNRALCLKLAQAGPRGVAEAINCKRLLVGADKARPRRGLKPARGGLIDSVHLAGMPRAA